MKLAEVRLLSGFSYFCRHGLPFLCSSRRRCWLYSKSITACIYYIILALFPASSWLRLGDAYVSNTYSGTRPIPFTLFFAFTHAQPLPPHIQPSVLFLLFLVCFYWWYLTDSSPFLCSCYLTIPLPPSLLRRLLLLLELMVTPPLYTVPSEYCCSYIEP